MTQQEAPRHEQTSNLQNAVVAGEPFFGSTSGLIPVKVYDKAGKEIRLPLPGLADSVGMVLKIPLNIPDLGLGSNESSLRVLSGEAGLGDGQSLTSPIRVGMVGLTSEKEGVYQFIDPQETFGRESDGYRVGLLMADVPSENFMPNILSALADGNPKTVWDMLDKTSQAVCDQLRKIHQHSGAVAEQLVRGLGSPETVSLWIKNNFFAELEGLPYGETGETYKIIKQVFPQIVGSSDLSRIIEERLRRGWVRKIHGDAQIDNIAVFPVGNEVQVEILDGITFEDENGNPRNWDVRDVSFDFAYFALSAAAKLQGLGKDDLASMVIAGARSRFLNGLEINERDDANKMFRLMTVYAGVVLADTFLRRSKNYLTHGDQQMADFFNKQAVFTLKVSYNNLFG